MEKKNAQIDFGEFIRKKEQTKATLDAIPEAKLATIIAVKDMSSQEEIEYRGKITSPHIIENPDKIQAVVVKGEIVAAVSRHYKLVQHKEAFEPIFEALHRTRQPYEFALFMTKTKAILNVFVDEIADNGSGIKLGFRVKNAIDGRNAITYSFKGKSFGERKEEKTFHKAITTIEFIGYRLACANGMIVRIPMHDWNPATHGKPLKIELKITKQEAWIETKVFQKVTELLSMAQNIAHIGNVEKKMEAIGYLTEAIAMMKKPIAAIFERAKDQKIGEVYAKKLIGAYIGKRMGTAIIDQFEREDQNLWGLYNAITFVASHGATIPTMNGLLDKSADLLAGEVFGMPLPAIKAKGKA